ncbi:MAG: adenosine kinase [Magnetococcales bacterium]|nr:adenosine kinase [Magnetococcales bacterium]
MKRYDVYSIGHALVDVEAEVDDAFLAQAGVEKGTMTLVDSTRQKELLALLEGRTVKRACGGSAANTVIGLSQFGGRGCFACCVAEDEPGAFFTAEMSASGVAYHAIPPAEPGPTGRCVVFVTPDAERSMCTHLGVSSAFSPDQWSAEHAAQADVVYIEGYLVTSPGGRSAAVSAARAAAHHGGQSALSFSDPNMVQYFRDGLEEILAEGVGLIFCNEREGMLFTGAATPEEALHRLGQRARRAALTLGAAGALLLEEDRVIRIPPFSARAVDTNGAGDLFAGALLHGLAQGWSLEAAGHLACRASATLVSQFGARLRPGQAQDILQAHRQA